MVTQPHVNPASCVSKKSGESLLSHSTRQVQSSGQFRFRLVTPRFETIQDRIERRGGMAIASFEGEHHSHGKFRVDRLAQRLMLNDATQGPVIIPKNELSNVSVFFCVENRA